MIQPPLPVKGSAEASGGDGQMGTQLGNHLPRDGMRRLDQLVGVHDVANTGARLS